MLLWPRARAIERSRPPAPVARDSNATKVPSYIHRLYRQPGRGSPRCDGEENRVTIPPCTHGFRDEHRRSRSFGNSWVESSPTLPHRLALTASFRHTYVGALLLICNQIEASTTTQIVN